MVVCTPTKKQRLRGRLVHPPDMHTHTACTMDFACSADPVRRPQGLVVPPRGLIALSSSGIMPAPRAHVHSPRCDDSGDSFATVMSPALSAHDPVPASIEWAQTTIARTGGVSCTKKRAMEYFHLQQHTRGYSGQRMAQGVCAEANKRRAPGTDIYRVWGEWIEPREQGINGGQVYTVTTASRVMRMLYDARKNIELGAQRKYSFGMNTGTLCEMLTTETLCTKECGVLPHFDIECTLVDGLNKAYKSASYARTMIDRLIVGIKSIFESLYKDIQVDPRSYKPVDLRGYMMNATPIPLCGYIVADGSRATKFSLHVVLWMRDKEGKLILWESNLDWGAMTRRMLAMRCISLVRAPKGTTTVVDMSMFTEYRLLRTLWACKNGGNRTPLRPIIAGPVVNIHTLDSDHHALGWFEQHAFPYKGMELAFDAFCVIREPPGGNPHILRCDEITGGRAISTTKTDPTNTQRKRRAGDTTPHQPPTTRARTTDVQVDVPLQMRIQDWIRATLCTSKEREQGSDAMWGYSKMLDDTLLSLCMKSHACRIKAKRMRVKPDDKKGFHTTRDMFWHIDLDTHTCRSFCPSDECRAWTKEHRGVLSWHIPRAILKAPKKTDTGAAAAGTDFSALA